MAKQKDIELKQKVSRDEFLQYLRQVQEGIEGSREFTVNVAGRDCTIPADAFDKGKLEIEYEIDEGEYELELTAKWKE